MPTVIVITGHPASGKSTIAERLGHDLNLVVLHRDGYKEVLFDTLGAGSLAESKRYGTASFALLLHSAECLLGANLSVVIEANFSPVPGRQEVITLAQTYHAPLIEVVTEAPPAVLATRFQRRIREGRRHPGHHDPEQLVEQTGRMNSPWQPLNLGGPLHRVDTSQPDQSYYPALLQSLQTELAIKQVPHDH